MIRRAIRYTVIVGAMLLASSIGAQESTSELRVKLSSADRSQVNGALVALLDAKDSVVAEGLASEDGIRILRAPRGAYRVRVRRIGYLPFVSTELTLPSASELVLNVESPRVVLQSIVVNSKSQCGRNDPNAQALSTVWDEIDKALRSSELTLMDLAGIGRARVYRREMGTDGSMVKGDSTEFSITDRRPFGAIDPDTLAHNGYVVGSLENGTTYFGPDESVLRSEQFGATHCFRLVRQRGHPGEIGVSFEPTPKRDLPDITGVIWVDQASAELREISFRFVNGGPMTTAYAGGFTRFRRVPSGAWIVDEWKLSVPRLGITQTTSVPNPRRTVIVIGRVDYGGGILRAPQ
jgi:hypothetical protein